MIQCRLCNLQYTGETKRRLKGRFNEHRRPILKPSGSYIETVVSEHYLSNSHSVTHIRYLSQLKHSDMNAIVSGKHARRTSFGKPKPSSLWEWTNVTNYNHYVIFNFFLGLFFLAASPYHVIPCNFCLLFYSSIYSAYSCFFPNKPDKD